MEYINNLRQRAQKRNWFKFRLEGSFLHCDVVTKEEKEILDTIATLKNALIRGFDTNSRSLGLLVPEKKCYVHGCRNKVIDAINVRDCGTLNVCKKHKIEMEELDGN